MYCIHRQWLHRKGFGQCSLLQCMPLQLYQGSHLKLRIDKNRPSRLGTLKWL